MVGLLIGQGLGAAIGMLVVRPRWRGIRNLQVAAGALAFSLPMVPHMMAGLVLNLGDRLVVLRYLGQAAVGRYQIAYNAAGIIILLLSVLNQAWEPTIYAAKDEVSVAPSSLGPVTNSSILRFR